MVALRTPHPPHTPTIFGFGWLLSTQAVAGCPSDLAGCRSLLSQLSPQKRTVILLFSPSLCPCLYLAFLSAWVRPPSRPPRRIDFRELVRDLFAVYKVGALGVAPGPYRARACVSSCVSLRITICRVGSSSHVFICSLCSVDVAPIQRAWVCVSWQPSPAWGLATTL